jgi:non-specific serine/threonine protein kinase
VAEDLITNFPHGVWIVELAQLSDPMLVPDAIVSVLGLREDPTRPLVERLKDYLDSKRLLLYLDNCEHLIEICAELVREIINASTQIRVLASSREALGISGEMPFLVPSLRLPDPGRLPNLSQLGTYEAVDLFIKRASLVQPSFSLNSQNAAAIARICVRLDGIPLAIELAAAQVKVLSPEQIAARLDDRFRLLMGGNRSVLPRQQTLKALIDWSYQLLSEPEQILFRRLSAFTGGWTLEAAEAVCSGEDIQIVDVLDLLTSLIEKSLIIKGEELGEARFKRLETIRQYARDKLQESGEEAAVRDRHKE